MFNHLNVVAFSTNEQVNYGRHTNTAAFLPASNPHTVKK